MRDYEMDIGCAVNEGVGSFLGKRPVSGGVRSCVASLRSGRDSERECDGGLGQDGVAEVVTCGSEPGLNAGQQDAVLPRSQLITTDLTQGCYAPRSYDLRTVRASVVGSGTAAVGEFDPVKTTERDCADRTEINGKNPSEVRAGDAGDTLVDGFTGSENVRNSDGDGCSFDREAEKKPGDCSPGDCSPGHCSYEIFSSDSEGEAEYDVEEAEDDDENSYDDWFAVANDEEEIRTIASADLRPFYGDFCRGAARQPFGDLGVSVGCDLEVELHSQPEFLEGFSCLETIVEETSDDMRSDVDSLRSGPVSWSWSVDSDESVSPAAVHPGPPGWTWCLEATPAATEGAADVAEDEDEPDVWNSDEDLASSLSLHPSSVPVGLPNSALETSKAQPLSLDEAPHVTATSRPFLKPLQMPPPLRAAAAPTLAKDLRPRVTGQVSRDLFVGSGAGCDPDEQPCHGGDLGWCDGGVTAGGASPAAGGAADRCADQALAAAGQGSHRSPTPQARLRPSVAGRGSREADIAAADGSAATPASHRHHPEVLGTQPTGQSRVSDAELRVNAQCWNGGGEPAHQLSAAANVTPGGCHLQQWDLGSCEDFGNLDRRIESLTFDFEEEERRTVAAIAAERLRLYDRYLRFLAEQESATQSGDSCSGVRRFHSCSDLRMVGDGRTARRDRPSLRKWVAAGSGIDTTGKRAAGRLTHLRHSSENLSEDSGFGEQAAVSWSDASSPPLSLSPSAGAEPSPPRLTADRRCRSTPDLSPSAQRRQRLLELIGRDERRRASVFSDSRSGAEAQNGRTESAEGLSVIQHVDTEVRGNTVAPERSSELVEVPAAMVACPVSHIPTCSAVGASSQNVSADVTDQRRPPEASSSNPTPSTPSQRQRKIQKPPMPAPRTVFPQPAAVYQNVPLNAWIAAGAGRGAAGSLDYQAPENALMRTNGRQLSQHQLRFQRSLRNLNTPDWYRNSARPAPPLRHQPAAAPPAGGWSGLHSKTTSRESLPAAGGATPTPLPRRLWASTVPRADSVPAAPRARHGSETSAESCSSALSGLRRPYLGWRSQERLSGGYQTAAERLARSFRSGGRRQVPSRGPPASSDGAAGIGRASSGAADSARLRSEVRLEPTGGEGQDVQKDIRDVTDAIVQYFEDATRPNGEAGVLRAGEETPPPPRPPPPHTGALNGSARDTASSKQRPLWRETAFMGGRPHSPDSPAGGSTAAPSADNSALPAAPPSRKDRFELGEFLVV